MKKYWPKMVISIEKHNIVRADDWSDVAKRGRWYSKEKYAVSIMGALGTV